MKKSLYLLAVLGLTACSVSEEQPEQTPPAQEEESTLPPEEIEDGKNHEESNENGLNSEILEEIAVDFDVKLPEEVPVSADKQVSATVESDANYYEVTYFETEETLAINENELVDEGAVLRIIGRAYDTSEEANQQVGYEEIQEGMPEVDLGYGITGYQDAGAGSVFTTWHEGRWSFTMRAANDELRRGEGEELAIEIVNKLEGQTLPIPHENGAGILSSGKNDDVETNRLAWQDGDVLYEVYMNDALQLIDLVTNEFE